MKSWYLGIKEYMQRQKMQSDKVQQQVKMLSEQYTKCTFKICRNHDIKIYLNGTDIKYIIKPFALQIPADGSTTYLVFKHKRAGGNYHFIVQLVNKIRYCIMVCVKQLILSGGN